MQAGRIPTAAQMIGYDIHDWARRGLLQSMDEVAAREEWDAVVPSDIQHLSKWQGQWVARECGDGRDPVNQAGTLCQPGLHGGCVQLEPAWASRCRSGRVHGNHLQIALARAGQAQAQQAVVRPEARVLTARLQVDTQLRFQPGLSAAQVVSGEHQVVQGPGGGRRQRGHTAG